MATWTEMKVAIEAQMLRDPQRATLSTRAWAAVEEGLRHLTGVGYNFEIAPKGTLVELVELKAAPKPQTMPLTMADAVEQIKGPQPVPTRSQFEARSTLEEDAA